MNYDALFLNLGRGNIDVINDDLRLMLLSSAYVFDKTHPNISSVPLIARHAETLADLQTKVWSLNAGDYVLTAANPTIPTTPLSGVATQAILYRKAALDADSYLLAHYTGGGFPITLSGGSVTLNFGSGRVFLLGPQVSGGGGPTLDPQTNEIDFDSVQGTSTFATIGKARDIQMANFPVIAGYTRTLKFECTLQSSTHGTTTRARLYDASAGVYVTGADLSNNTAVDQSKPESYSATVSAGTSAGTIRTDVNNNYELHVLRVGGNPSDLVKASARITVLYS